ncbi:PREDICTED: membrane cofactor protein-like [Myotis davidii]|uniref:membrane cofactor protein-like n=1 Tax=Myotis davidii TaxID=225400 RepID=UPI0007678F5E|nr:PREDICTED: membrane cofactor protein-like [Myotis davidii]
MAQNISIGALNGSNQKLPTTCAHPPRRAPAPPCPARPAGHAHPRLLTVSPAIVASGARGREGLCGKPPVFQSMKLKVPPQPAYLPGEKVYYQCNPGYYYSYFYGLSTYCEKNNSWYPIDEACYKKECPAPKVPNGKVYEQYEPQTGFQFDKDAYFYCNYGYYLKGEPIVTCKLSGDTVYWGGDIPTCEKILCGEPGIIENGKRTNSWRVEFEFNEVVTYTCDPSDGPQEYSLVGESKLSCSGPDKWSSGPPQCKGNDISIYSSFVNTVETLCR